MEVAEVAKQQIRQKAAVKKENARPLSLRGHELSPVPEIKEKIAR